MATYKKQLKDQNGDNIIPALGTATVTSTNIDWSTMFQLDDVTVKFSNSSKTAKKVHLGGNVYAIMYHGQTGVTSASGGAKQITITYPAFTRILFAVVKYTVSGQTSPSTGHSNFGAASADTYVYPNEQAGSVVNADMLIIGTMV